MTQGTPAFENWNNPEKLGEGGQGTVYLSQHSDVTSERSKLILRARTEIRQLIRELQVVEREESAQSYHSTVELFRAIERWTQLSEKSLGAIKQFKIPEGEPEASKTLKRLEREVEALSTTEHPAILRLLGSNAKRHWMATEYHPRGTLHTPANQHLFKGQVLESLKAFRPLVEAVSILHEKGHVHRDVKTDNIFVAGDGRLVLGDFGIVFYKDADGERPTETYERVGTRDWMAPWANIPKRLETVNGVSTFSPSAKFCGQWFRDSATCSFGITVAKSTTWSGFFLRTH